MRLVAIFLISLSISSALAYSKENLIRFYETYYKEELGIGFLVKKYNIHSPKLRAEIISYIKDKDWEVDSKTIEEEWLSFIKTNYPNPLELKKTIENNYHDINEAKAKFIDDLDLDKYFNIVVVPRLEKDFTLRNRLINGVITAKITPIQKLEAQKQFLANLKLNSLDELETEFNLDKEDLDFLLTSNFLLEKKSFSIYNLDLQKRIHNLKANSNLTTKEAKKYIFRDYQSRIEYLN